MRSLLAAMLVACGTTPKPLPERVADRPLTVPAHTVELDLDGGGAVRSDDRFVEHRALFPGGVDLLGGAIHYGITDRLSWEGLALAYAVATQEEHGFHLRLRGPFEGLGWSTVEGWIVQVRVDLALKRSFGPWWIEGGPGYRYRSVERGLRQTGELFGYAGGGRQIARRWSALATAFIDDRRSTRFDSAVVGGRLVLAWATRHWLDLRLWGGADAYPNSAQEPSILAGLGFGARW